MIPDPGRRRLPLGAFIKHCERCQKVVGSLTRTAYPQLQMPLYFHFGWFMFFLFYSGFLIWCWVAWLKSKPKVLGNWRAAVLLIGLLCATLSVTLNNYLYVHAMYTGGYPFYHPIELMCMRWGTLTAMLGIVAAIASKGRGRIPLGLISVLNLLLWFADAMAQ